MLKGVFKPLLCSVFLVGQMIHAQEVVVPHETKPEAPEQAAPSSESEQTPSESAAPVRTKPRPREKKSVAPTLEQMRTPVKREAQVEKKSASRPSTTRSTKLEPIGPVRPTIIESGREQPSATPSAKAAAPNEQVPAP